MFKLSGNRFRWSALLVAGSLFVASCGQLEQEVDRSQSFTLAVIPDTQNYTDYSHQKKEGFALDASELFIEQMQFIADNAVTNGGDIAFVAAVGDVWQHQNKLIDPEHEERGFKVGSNPILSKALKITDKVVTVEIPKAIEGYRIISEAGLPFGVAPGNHDYDAMWPVPGYSPNLDKDPRELEMTVEDLGLLHVGGLDNFRSAFGSDTAFFKDQPWYIDSFRGGANAAQVFTAGGYTFLHITHEMQPDNEVIEWIEKVLSENPGVPTIMTTHDYLNTSGERLPNPIVDLALADPEGNNGAEQMWQKLYGRHDQIFMVLCGHQHGQSMRIDNNINGFPVYQILADYQGRGQAGLDAGQPPGGFLDYPEGIGDGWFRLMRFDFTPTPAKIEVKTYSSHYNRYSGEEPDYATWYRDYEQPGMEDKAFYQLDDYVITLEGFKERFAGAAIQSK